MAGPRHWIQCSSQARCSPVEFGPILIDLAADDEGPRAERRRLRARYQPLVDRSGLHPIAPTLGDLVEETCERFEVRGLVEREDRVVIALREDGDELNRRWRQNTVLNKWLDYLSDQGHLILDR